MPTKAHQRKCHCSHICIEWQVFELKLWNMYIFCMTARSPDISMVCDLDECVSSCLLKVLLFTKIRRDPVQFTSIGKSCAKTNSHRQRSYSIQLRLMKRRSKIEQTKKKRNSHKRPNQIVCERDFKRENAMSKDSISLFNKTESTIFSTMHGFVRISISFSSTRIIA